MFSSTSWALLGGTSFRTVVSAPSKVSWGLLCEIRYFYNI